MYPDVSAELVRKMNKSWQVWKHNVIADKYHWILWPCNRVTIFILHKPTTDFCKAKISIWYVYLCKMWFTVLQHTLML